MRVEIVMRKANTVIFGDAKNAYPHEGVLIVLLYGEEHGYPLDQVKSYRKYGESRY